MRTAVPRLRAVSELRENRSSALVRMLALGLSLAGCSDPGPHVADPPAAPVFSLGETPLTAFVDVEELPDGKFLVAGPGSGQVVCRLHPTGTLDESFGDAGCVYAQPYVFTNVRPAEVLLRDRGLSVFGSWDLVDAPDQTQVFEVQMTSSGEVFLTSSGNLGDGAFLVDVVKQGDSSALVGGTATDAFVARMGAGYTVERFGTGPPRDAALLKDGRLVVSMGRTLLAFDAHGRRVMDFGHSGTVELPFDALTLAADGSRIVAAGPGMAVARISYDGDVTDVFYAMDMDATPRDAVVDPDGAILLTGTISSSTADRIALGRLTRTGTATLHPVGPGAAFDIELAHDGRIFLAGARDETTPAMFVPTLD